jgi:hypothetical protein
MEPEYETLSQAYVSALNAIPGVTANLMHGADASGLDMVAWAEIAGRKFTLLLELKTSVYPRDVYRILHQFKNHDYQHGHNPNEHVVLPVLVADSISTGAQNILRRERVAFYDRGGSLFLTQGGTFIDRVCPPAPSEVKVLKSIYSGARARVLTALLVKPDDWFSVGDLCEKAKVSAGTASEVLTTLEDLDWVQVQGGGPSKLRKVAKPGDILDAWADHVRGAKPAKIKRYYIPYLDQEALPALIAQQLSENDAKYAFTGEFAAQHYAPYLTVVSQIRARVVWDENAALAMQGMSARQVAEGANFAAIETSSEAELLYRTKEHELWYANPIHIYLDLIKAEGRAKDMAKFFRTEKIKF